MSHNWTLQGKYGFYRTGTEILGGPVVHLAAAGLMDFDGTGKFTAYQNASDGGSYVANNQSAGFCHVYPSGVFTLSDTTYVAVDQFAIDLTKVQTVGVVVDEGNELHALSTKAGRAVLFHAKKM